MSEPDEHRHSIEDGKEDRLGRDHSQAATGNTHVWLRELGADALSIFVRNGADFASTGWRLGLKEAYVRHARTSIDDQNHQAIKNSIVNRKRMWSYSVSLQLLQAMIFVRLMRDWRSRRSMAMEKERQGSGEASELAKVGDESGESEARETSQSFAKSPSFRPANHVLNRIRPVAHAELGGSLFESTFEIDPQDRFQFAVPVSPLRSSKRTSR
jgi:hypothetical protein